MGRDDDKHKLHGEIEIDEAFFKLEPIPEKNSRDHLVPVLVMAESQEVTDSKYRIHRKFGHLKMKVVHMISAAQLKYTAQKYIDSNAVLRGDGTKNHNYMRSVFQEVSGEILKNHKDILRVLPWAHICIGHSKNQIRDIYHDVTREYLQLYLDEFCWKKNHRKKDLFDSLVKIVAENRYVWRPVNKHFDMVAYLAKNADKFRFKM